MSETGGPEMVRKPEPLQFGATIALACAAVAVLSLVISYHVVRLADGRVRAVESEVRAMRSELSDLREGTGPMKR